MPEAASLAHMLAPVRSAGKSSRDVKPDSVPHKLRSEKADSAIKSDNGSIPEQSVHEKDQGPDDFDRVLSRKIDGQKEQSLDEHSQGNTVLAETAELNLTRNMSCSGPAQGTNLFENTDEQCTPEQAVAEINSSLKNTGDIQLAENAGIMGETMNPASQMKGQSSEQSQGVPVQLTVSEEKPVSAKITAEAEPPVDGKQLQGQKAVMTENMDVSRNNNAERKQFHAPEATEQIPKQLSNESDLEIRPVGTGQDKSVHPDFQAVLRGARGEQQQNFQSQSDNSGAAGQFQGETPDIKDSRGIPFEAETSLDGYDETPKGFDVRNVQSMLHSAEPAENASLSALEAPARTGIHSNIPQAEITKPVDQILHHLSLVSVSGTQQRIKLTLTPEHLGTVRITFNQTEGEVVGLLEVQKNQTRREVEQALPQLISAIQSSGVQVRRIEVVQWNASQDSAEDETAEDSDYSATGQFRDESSSNSSESGMLGNARFAGHGEKTSQLSQISEQDDPIYDAGVTEGGLNMFI